MSSTLRISLFRASTEEPGEGFDFGDMVFEFDGKIFFDSRIHTRFKMMIYISLCNLIEAISFIKIRKKIKFCAVGSSFDLLFLMKKNNIVVISDMGGNGKDASFDNLVTALAAGLKEFFYESSNRLLKSDPVFFDLESAIISSNLPEIQSVKELIFK